jgi:hypothetical protein
VALDELFVILSCASALVKSVDRSGNFMAESCSRGAIGIELSKI